VELVRTDSRRERGGETPAERLRRLIARKRSEKERLEAEMRESRRQLAELAAMRQERLDPLDEEVHRGFADLLESGRFSAAALEEVAALYERLVARGFLSAGAARDGDGDGEVRVCGCPRCVADREAEARGEGAGGEDRAAPPPGRHAGPSRSLKDLYRQLASRYHPDKAEDEETRVENERLMRAINGAYASGDVDALASLTEELGFEIAGDGVLEALAAQYARVKAEVRALREDFLGQLVVETRRCRRNGEPPPLEVMAGGIVAHAEGLAELLALLRDHRDGAIDDEELLAELLGEAADEGHVDGDEEADEEEWELSPEELDRIVAAVVAAGARMEQATDRPPRRSRRDARVRKRREAREARKANRARRKRWDGAG
jgi:hypothetical protein